MASNSQDERINEDQLEFEDNLRCYENVPFTGVGFEVFPNNRIESETHYRDGLADGLVSEWDESGLLRAQFHCRKGMIHGSSKTWHGNGALKEDAHYEWGVELDATEFDEQGTVVAQRNLDPDNPESNYKILLNLRKIMTTD